LPQARIRVGAVIALAAVAGVVVWLVVRHHGNHAAQPKSSVAGLSRTGLRTIADQLGSPIYWAGPERGVKYELTQTPSGRIYVRYLPFSATVGTNHPYPFVATFPLVNAFAATVHAASQPGAVKLPVGSDAVAFYSRNSPTNVYLAYRGSKYQIEVYDPRAAGARRLVTMGLIQSVSPNSPGAVAPPRITQASVPQLRTLAKALGHPVYWLGAQLTAKYELTQTQNGRVYVRYLPSGAPIGTSRPYPFVATFPLPNAFGATSTAAKAPGAVKLPVKGGAVAFYSSSTPTNVYIAFPNSAYQIELFDPNAARAKSEVLTGKVQPIP
jgi:hypothetical protein